MLLVVVARKFVPTMVTGVPIGPLVGLKLVIVGLTCARLATLHVQKKIKKNPLKILFPITQFGLNVSPGRSLNVAVVASLEDFDPPPAINTPAITATGNTLTSNGTFGLTSKFCEVD